MVWTRLVQMLVIAPSRPWSGSPLVRCYQAKYRVHLLLLGGIAHPNGPKPLTYLPIYLAPKGKKVFGQGNLAPTTTERTITGYSGYDDMRKASSV